MGGAWGLSGCYLIKRYVVFLDCVTFVIFAGFYTLESAGFPCSFQIMVPGSPELANWGRFSGQKSLRLQAEACCSSSPLCLSLRSGTNIFFPSEAEALEMRGGASSLHSY